MSPVGMKNMFYSIFGLTGLRSLKEGKKSEETGNLH
jgi:hypothetical protein